VTKLFDRNILEHIFDARIFNMDCTQYCKAVVLRATKLLERLGKTRVSFIDIYGVDGFFLVKNTRKSLFFLWPSLPTE